MKDDRIYEALVELTTEYKQAIKALRKLTGEKFLTSDDWKRWWAAR